MKVKINENYKGVYGHFIPELGTVIPKRAGDIFDVDPKIVDVKRHISNGVMVAVEPVAITPEVHEPKAEPVTEPVKEIKAKTPDYDTMSYPDLRDAAKDRGISAKNVKKEKLIALLKDYDAQNEPPVLNAALPE